MNSFPVTQTVAQTILQQLKATSSRKMLCWGSRQFIGMGNGLKFKVSGLKFTGYVYVIYETGSDTYKVQLGVIRKGAWVVKKEVNDVYWDNLGDVIDGLVER